jgi:hypothetical protein
MDDWRHRLTEGYHKLALSMQSLTVEASNREKRLERLEDIGTELPTQLAVIDNRLTSVEADLKKHMQSDTNLAVAREKSRATIAAAWIGGIVAGLAAIASLIMHLTKG